MTNHIHHAKEIHVADQMSLVSLIIDFIEYQLADPNFLFPSLIYRADMISLLTKLKNAVDNGHHIVVLDEEETQLFVRYSDILADSLGGTNAALSDSARVFFRVLTEPIHGFLVRASNFINRISKKGN